MNFYTNEELEKLADDKDVQKRITDFLNMKGELFEEMRKNLKPKEDSSPASDSQKEE